MGISMNGPSGIDTAYIIDSLVELERNKVLRVEREKSAYEVKIDAYSKLASIVSELGTRAKELSTASAFDIFTETSSNEDILTFSAGTGTTEGQYDVSVFHLAGREKMISAEGLFGDQTVTLDDLGIGGGVIGINGEEITLNGTDTNQDLGMRINNATTETGEDLGVTASVLKVSDTDYRLILTAEETGANGIEYTDVSGTVFQGLGILDAAGEKGNTVQSLRSADDIGTLFSTLAPNDVIQYGGTDHAGNAVSGTFIMTASSDIDDLLDHIEQRFHGMAGASIDETTGELVITDLISGHSQLMVSSFTVNGADHAVNLDQAGEQGDGVLSAGSDAFLAIDGILVRSRDNEASGYIPGVTMNLKKAAVDETVTLTIDRDLEGIKEEIQELLDAFNTLISFADESTDYGDPEDEESVAGILAGDMTVHSIVNRFRMQFQTRNSLFEGNYNSLTMLGVKTDTTTGEMTIDDEMFTEALRTSFDEVVRLFVTTGFSDNASITLGRFDEETSSGRYTLEEISATQFSITREGETDSHTSDPRIGDIVGFSEGPARGLSLTIPPGAVGVGNTATFTFSKGLGDLIRELTDSLTDSREGVISMRQESWRSSIRRADERIDWLEQRVEGYRERLVQEFSTMEKVLSGLQSQSANMMSMLGYGTTA